MRNNKLPIIFSYFHYLRFGFTCLCLKTRKIWNDHKLQLIIKNKIVNLLKVHALIKLDHKNRLP